MAIPGLEDMVGNGVRGAVSGFVWPRRMVIPIVAGTDVGPLQARPSGVFIVRVVKAKDLISVDMSFGRSIDPYFRLARRPALCVGARWCGGRRCGGGGEGALCERRC